MTQVDFHTAVPDRLNFACRLLRKAYLQGRSVLVTAPEDELSRLDRELWAFDAHSFVPHLRLKPGATATTDLARTPIWLSAAPVDDAREVLVNLGADAPADPARFQRIVEIVGETPEDARGGRLRGRRYSEQGLQPTHHRAGAMRGADA